MFAPEGVLCDKLSPQPSLNLSYICFSQTKTEKKERTLSKWQAVGDHYSSILTLLVLFFMWLGPTCTLVVCKVINVLGE